MVEEQPSAAASLGWAAAQSRHVDPAQQVNRVLGNAIGNEAPSGAGTASALYSSAFMSAGLLAGAITGVAVAAIGFGNVFWVCAALAAAAASLLLARARV